MEASQEIRDVMASWFEAVARGDVGWRDRHVSGSPDLRIIGTDPEEWLRGQPAFAFLRNEAAAAGGKLRISVGEIEGFVEGSVGWGAASPEITLPDGSHVAPRWSAVFHREGTAWKLVQTACLDRRWQCRGLRGRPQPDRRMTGDRNGGGRSRGCVLAADRASEVGVDREAVAERLDARPSPPASTSPLPSSPLAASPSTTSTIQSADLAELGLAEAAGGAGGRAEADARGDGRLLGVEGDAVLVAGDVGAPERLLGGLARHALGAQVDQHQMVVGAAGDDVEPALHQLVGQGLGVRRPPAPA